jgi:hypothetical protein
MKFFNHQMKFLMNTLKNNYKMNRKTVIYMKLFLTVQVLKRKRKYKNNKYRNIIVKILKKKY